MIIYLMLNTVIKRNPNQSSTYEELSKCFDPVTLPSGVEPAPVEVPQLIQCVVLQPNHVKVHDVAAIVHM